MVSPRLFLQLRVRFWFVDRRIARAHAVRSLQDKGLWDIVQLDRPVRCSHCTSLQD